MNSLRESRLKKKKKKKDKDGLGGHETHGAAHRNARIPKFETPNSQISDVSARPCIFYSLLFFYFLSLFFSTESARAARNSSAPRVNAFQAKIGELFKSSSKVRENRTYRVTLLFAV